MTTESIRDRAERMFREQDPDADEQYTLDEILAILEENAAMDRDLDARGKIGMPDWEGVDI
jgi:hypothetical protein